MTMSVHHCGSYGNISTTIGWIAMMFSTDTRGPHRMNPTDFSGPVAFP